MVDWDRMAPQDVVVDGSNIATEGRSIPSLAQLDEAVTQYQAEFPGSEVIVVVDATFGHRIDPSERAAFDEAVAHAEMVSPPAGAVGRGDAFLLRVAERVGAKVLSNDSFQEFHAEHPWLFDPGRLIGGKPVPGVGWIFTPRSPVRGARSRAALAVASRKGAKKAAKAGGGAKAAKADTSAGTDKSAKAAKGARSERAARTDKGARTAKSAGTDTAAGAAPAEKVPRKRSRGGKAAQAEKVATAAKAQKGAPVKGAARSSKAKSTEKAPKATKAGKADKTDKAAKAAKAAKVTKLTKAAKSTRQSKASRVAPADKTTKPTHTAPAQPPSADRPKGSSRRRRGRGRRAANPDVAAAIDVATVEATAPPDGKASASARGTRRRSEPPPAVNDPLTFLTFVSDYPIGSVVEGTVESYVSHGAMVDVGAMRCYVPLAGLGSPPPRRSREVLERGERRQFVLVALDPARRGAELSLPPFAARDDH